MASSEVPPQDGEPAGSSGGYPTAAGETVEPDVSAEQEERGHSRFGALLGSASSLKKKASPFLNKARQAIVEEAKQVKDDMRDIAGGVREGMQLTKQDLEEQTRGWRSAFGAKLRSFGAKRDESPRAEEDDKAKENEKEKEKEKESSALHAVRQNLAMTAKDVSELRQEVMNEVRLSVNDIRQVLRCCSSPMLA
ncbi:unnamed protein product [Durusdinium trenchii]|uniref:Uncharacterized protein n=1 Tax=Durusdinium trenchii TaxID=1381693 RepID=A0ABP0RV81_9DINO